LQTVSSIIHPEQEQELPTFSEIVSDKSDVSLKAGYAKEYSKEKKSEISKSKTCSLILF
jgi:hypothetical protein